MLFLNSQRQHKIYQKIIHSRRKTFLFSCGYYERYDPFLLDKKPFMRSVFENIFDDFFPEKSESVLDLGCGTCFYWPLLVKHCNILEGLDYSEAMLCEAKKLVNSIKDAHVNLKQGSGDSLPYDDKSFDKVIAFDVLHHIPDLDSTMKEIRRVLKTNGTFVNLEPNMVNPVMFLAHVIPSEERRAIIRNWPWILRNKFRQYFQTVEMQFTNIVVSANSDKANTFLENLDVILNIVPIFKSLKFRLLSKSIK